MKAINFHRSFVTFRIDTEKKPPQTVSHRPPFSLNNARIQLDCRLRITEHETGETETFVLGANCKTERVGVDRDIWTEPNADFVPIFSDTHFLNLKTYARAGIEVDRYPPGDTQQPDRQHGRIADTFDQVKIDVCECVAEVLSSPGEIIDATLSGVPLVARTEITSRDYSATVEYPIKTMNANERDGIYQTDTGPVLLPDLSVGPEKLMKTLQLAFVAFNNPNWSEWLVREAVEVMPGISVYHYARPLRIEGRNEVLWLDI